MGIPFRKLIENGNPWILYRKGDIGSAAMTAAYYTGGIGMKGFAAYMTWGLDDPKLGAVSAGFGILFDVAGYATNYLMNKSNDRIRERFERTDVFIMSLGQMSNIPPSRLFSYKKGELINERIYIKNNLKASGFLLYSVYIPKALFSVIFDLLRALKTINFTCDIFYAQHFLPAFVAIILRRLGILKCDKIFFRMFDFFPIPSEFLRGLYYRGIDVIQGFTTHRLMHGM